MLSPSNQGIIAQYQHALHRRQVLIQDLQPYADFAGWAESCVPSYCHANWMAAGVSWQRLFAAVRLMQRYAPIGSILDFGASVGELGHLLTSDQPYDFIEQDDRAAQYLQQSLPKASRQTLLSAMEGHYACVFALDSLEHNHDYPTLIEQLVAKLAPQGCLILSGPTENVLYRLGRAIAGFEADYHHTTIAEIEAVCRSCLIQRARITVPLGIPLFHLSVWQSAQKP